MIPAKDFADAGEVLRVGLSTRIEHWCGEGRVLKVEKKEDGIHAYCFRCVDKGWIPLTLSLEDRLKKLLGQKTADTEARTVLALPGPKVTDPQQWPATASTWLYKAGLSNWEIEHRGIYFNPSMERVVIPVYSKGELVYWQARGFDSGRPKYVNPQVNRSAVTYDTGKGGITVLTEDILSAIRVGKVHNARSIMGVNLTPQVLLSLVEDGRPVVVALDPDPPGIAGSLSVFNQLQAVGLPSVNVTPQLPCDPKLMTLEDIRCQMNNLFT